MVTVVCAQRRVRIPVSKNGIPVPPESVFSDGTRAPCVNGVTNTDVLRAVLGMLHGSALWCSVCMIDDRVCSIRWIDNHQCVCVCV